MGSLLSGLKHAWNAFVNERNNTALRAFEGGTSYGRQPSSHRMRYWNERSIIASIYTRIGIDVASVDIRHVRTDDEGRYQEDIPSGLNSCLTWEANMDQAAMKFKLDILSVLFNEGSAAIVPVDTTLDPNLTNGFDIKTMRVGRIVTWHPRHVRVSLYNEDKGYQEELILEKKFVAIVENPFYTVMNEPNSTLQRLIRKLNLLDVVDDQSSSGKLDIIIQLPYNIKSEARREQARQRRDEMEYQLTNSKYGVAYSDSTEKVIQLNRPAENNLLKQVDYLVGMLYSQLGLTVEVMNGTADEAAMLNYKNRTVEPLVRAIVEAMRRAFITKTGRAQGQTILYFNDPFKLATLKDIAEFADVFSRNEIMAPNELRSIVGVKPHKDPKADQLVNSNMPQPGKPSVPAVQPSRPRRGRTELE